MCAVKADQVKGEITLAEPLYCSMYIGASIM